jgi:hypothetical protein
MLQEGLAADAAEHHYAPTAHDPPAEEAVRAALAFLKAYGRPAAPSDLSTPVAEKQTDTRVIEGSHPTEWEPIGERHLWRLNELGERNLYYAMGFLYDMDAHAITLAGSQYGDYLDLRGYEGDRSQPRFTVSQARELSRKLFASVPHLARLRSKEELAWLSGDYKRLP